MTTAKMPDPDCAPFVAACLHILDKRYTEARRGTTFWLPGTHIAKRFSEREMGEETGINWPALKDGRRRGLPSRDVVTTIADYLDCSLNERNVLLAAAHYAPVEPLLEGDALDAAVTPYRAILYKYLHYPALIINRNWDILDVNPAALSLFAMADAPNALSGDAANILWLLFDRALPLRPMLDALGSDYWREVVINELLAFRMENALYRHEGWYAALVERLAAFPDFAALYAAADPANHSAGAGVQFPARFRRADGGIINIKPLFIRTGNPLYPQIVACVPNDKATERIFTALGFALPAWADRYIG